MADAAQLLEPILTLHERIRDAVVAACTEQASEQLAAVASDGGGGGGDTIYAIDRVGEETLVQGLTDLARTEPLCLIGEGLTGDVLVLPAGTGHCNAGSADLLVIGAYPDGMSWDLRRGDPAEHEEVLQNIAGVPLPKADPVEGADGSLLNLWGKT